MACIYVENEIPDLTYKYGEQVMLLQDTIGEHLQKADQMAWVRVTNQHRAIAEEIILKELIYV